jgi:hypothetical protein
VSAHGCVTITGMGRFAARAQVAIALIALPLLAAPATQAAPDSGVSGQVRLDGTCIAPGARCDSRGVEATIRVERARSGRLVRTVHTRTGRFHVRLRPGRYRLRATAEGGNGAGSARVRVERHRFTAVVLRLHSAAP